MFADDPAVVVVAKQSEDVDVYANETIGAIKGWLETVLITNPMKRNTIRTRIRGFKADYQIPGLMTEAKINFKGHLDYA